MALPLFFTKYILVSVFSLTLCVVTSTEASQSAVNASENQSRHGKGNYSSAKNHGTISFSEREERNDPCTTGGTRNGTCYTQGECTSREGTSLGACANGFGVCCAFILSCGGMSSENCTYIVQAATTIPINPCKYTICPCDKHICRLRFDFTGFNINGPVTASAFSDPNLSAPTTQGGAIGDCTTDSFTITAPGNFAPPLICGFNSGQHMIVDACAEKCNEVNFGLAGGGTRSWDIKVTQYACGDEQGGPDGCLQYFTGLTGTVASFNFPTTATSLDTATTHLSSQCQVMCWRQEMNTCAICWIPEILGSDEQTGSFGISAPVGNKARGENDGKCRGDFLLIPDAQANVATEPGDTFIVGSLAGDVRLSDRLCGRFLSSANSNADRKSSISICSQQRPFRMTFKTDADEVTQISTIPAANSAKFNELNRVPGGIVGFNLRWTLQSCT